MNEKANEEHRFGKAAAGPSALKAYFLASRPRTWPASICPVLIGTAMAPKIDLPIFFLTLFFSLFIQIGTNYANDYFDFIKGTDNNLRKGPKRASQQGWIAPSSMLIASLLLFACAFLFAIPLMLIAGLWSLPVALLCIAFGILYTGGPKPLGYLGLGEILVFPFFGPIAVCGTYFLQTLSFSPQVLLASLAPGFISCSILIANNLRDEENDRAAKKKTLIVRLGRLFGSWEYTVSILAAALIPLALIYFYSAPVNLIATSFLFFAAIPSIKKAFLFQDPLELIPVLKNSAVLLLLYTLFFCYFIGTSHV